MMYFIMAIGIAYIIIRPIIILFSRNKTTKEMMAMAEIVESKEIHPNSKEAKEFADRVLNEVNKIIECSKRTTDNLCADLVIKNPAILFEQIAFLFFLNNLQNILQKTPEEISGEILPCLLNSIQEASKTVFDDKSDELLKFVQERSDVYCGFFERYGITDVFFYHIFTYQTVLINCIQKNNKISNFKIGPLNLHEKDIRNEIGDSNFDNIKNALEKNKQIYTEFYNN